MPEREVLLPDACISQAAHLPPLTAPQIAMSDGGALPVYSGADFDLRMASSKIFNGMVSLTFSCDGSHYMRYGEFLERGTAFWSGIAA